MVHVISEPSRGFVGTLLRDMLTDPEFPRSALSHLFVADHICNMVSVRRWLAAGAVVITDRWWDYSSEAYGTSLPRVASITPDVTLYLRVSPEVAWSRIRVKQRFDSDLARIAERYDAMRLTRIDANRSEAEVAADVLAEVMRRLR